MCTACDDEEIRIFDLAAGINKAVKTKQISVPGAPLGAVFLGGKDRIAVLMKGRCTVIPENSLVESLFSYMSSLCSVLLPMGLFVLSRENKCGFLYCT